ncbi:WhiB family transcriptional regulator [Modestobacter sp. SYSU DS0290]
MQEWSELCGQLAAADWISCRTSDPEAWWAGGGYAARMAVAGCGECPVRVACLDYALAANECGGTWGGMTAGERQRLRSSRTAVAA